MQAHGLPQYLSDCHGRLRDAQVGHFAASDYYRRIHYAIGVTLIIATTVVSSSLLVEGGSVASPLALALSILATILAALQTFLRPDERAERHRSAATAYGALKREVEVALLGDEPSTRAFMEALVKRWADVASTAPVTPQAIRRKALGEERASTDELASGPLPPPARS